MMRGIDSRHEIDPTQLLRDTRSFGQRISDFFSKPTNAAIVVISLAATAFYLPEMVLLTLILGGIVLAQTKTPFSSSTNSEGERF